jgi:hypothetical protein
MYCALRLSKRVFSAGRMNDLFRLDLATLEWVQINQNKSTVGWPALCFYASAGL